MALSGVRVIEMAGLAPAPFCGMILSDFGAKVIRVDRVGAQIDADRLSRGKQSISVNLKHQDGVKVLRKLCRSSDVIIEPFRKGVMEKLGLGPRVLLEDNPRLIYARLTGYGQSGPLSVRAGHDINYLAISGVLSRLGRHGDKPRPPVNLLADFAGGGLTCALGIVMALYQREKTGRGQVIDSNMVEGAAYVGSFLWGIVGTPIWAPEKGKGWLDGGAHFYNTYETKDGKYVAVGAIEPQFYDELIKGLGLTHEQAPHVGGNFDELRKKFAEIFASKTRSEWSQIFDNVDACVTPVLSMDEAASYPHNMKRGAFAPTQDAARFAPRPAPSLRGTDSKGDGGSDEIEPFEARPQPTLGQHTVEVLREVGGYGSEEIKELLESRAVEQGTGSNVSRL